MLNDISTVRRVICHRYTKQDGEGVSRLYYDVTVMASIQNVTTNDGDVSDNVSWDIETRMTDRSNARYIAKQLGDYYRNLQQPPPPPPPLPAAMEDDNALV